MTITQTVTIPADYRLFLELPRTVPSGVIARVQINIPVQAGFNIPEKEYSTKKPSSKIEEIRQLLQNEMAIQGTSTAAASSGDGWEAYVRERYGES